MKKPNCSARNLASPDLHPLPKTTRSRMEIKHAGYHPYRNTPHHLNPSEQRPTYQPFAFYPAEKRKLTRFRPIQPTELGHGLGLPWQPHDRYAQFRRECSYTGQYKTTFDLRCCARLDNRPPKHRRFATSSLQNAIVIPLIFDFPNSHQSMIDKNWVCDTSGQSKTS